MAIGKKQCVICGAMCWTQAKACPSGHEFVKGRSPRGPAKPGPAVVATSVAPADIKLDVVHHAPPAKTETAPIKHVNVRAGMIPDKTFGGEGCPKGAQIIYAAAGDPPHIELIDITNRDRLYAWVRSTRALGHSQHPAQHYTLSALHAMILAQHSVCEETRVAYELLYEGLSPDQREVA